MGQEGGECGEGEGGINQSHVIQFPLHSQLASTCILGRLTNWENIARRNSS